MNSLEHKTVRHMLHDLVDGDLSSAKKQEVEEHLAHCLVCREELEDLKNTLGMLRALPRPAAPPDLEAKIRRRIRRRGAPGRRQPRIEQRIETTSAVAVLVAAIIVLGTRLMVPVPENLESTGKEAERAPAARHMIQIQVTAGEQATARVVWNLAATQGALDASGKPLPVLGSADEIASGGYLIWLEGIEAEALGHHLVSVGDPDRLHAVLESRLLEQQGQAVMPEGAVTSESMVAERKPRSEMPLDKAVLLLVVLEEEAEAASFD